MKYLVVDVETSGITDYRKPADAEGQPYLASLAMIFLDDQLAVEREQQFLIKPDGWVMPKEAEAINGLSTEHLTANGVPVRDALLAYSLAIEAGYVVVGFNVQFDAKIIRGSLRRNNLPDLFEKTATICVMRGLVGVCKIPYANGRGGFKFPKLAEAMAHFKIPQDGHHTAMGDARSALALFLKGMEIGVMPQPEVHYAKPGTAAGEAAGLGPAAPRGKPAAKPRPAPLLDEPVTANSDIPE
jgi:DNA polymerase-3 subunit epsilon